ncbi:hypothetical protein [Sphingomonas swuensis]
MRRLLPFAALSVAACAGTPPPAPTPQPASLPAQPTERGALIGRSQAELVARLGNPTFQVREGIGLKLQWQNDRCVIDAYLYPPASGTGVATATHVDSRRPLSGDDLPQDACLASFSG